MILPIRARQAEKAKATFSRVTLYGLPAEGTASYVCVCLHTLMMHTWLDLSTSNDPISKISHSLRPATWVLVDFKCNQVVNQG